MQSSRVFAIVLAALAGCGGRQGYSYLDGSRRVGGDDDGVTYCDEAADCDDGLFCNGAEACAAGLCAPGTPPSCPPSDDMCTMNACDETTRGCLPTDTDADADGHRPVACGGDDCDDARAEVHPGADEICDYLDNDCDGSVDEMLTYEGLGTVLNVSAPEPNGAWPDMHFDGTNFDVVFDDRDSPSAQVFHSTVPADGSTEDGPSQRTFSNILSSSAALGWTGSEYGLFAHFHVGDVEPRGAIALTRLDVHGSRITGALPITPDSPDADAPAAAWDGQAWGVAYVTNVSATAHPVRFVRVGPEGAALGADWQIGSGDVDMVRPSVVWAAQGFLVAHVEAGQLIVSAVEPDGQSLQAETAVGGSARVAPALAVGDEEAALVWVAPAGHARFLVADLSGSMTPANIGGDHALGVDLVWNGREYAATYADALGGETGTFLVRIAPRASWVSQPGRIASESPRPDAATAVAFNGTQYGVAYTTGPQDSGAISFQLAGCP